MLKNIPPAQLVVDRLTISDINYQLAFALPSRPFLFRVSNRNTRTMREICSKLTIKMLEQRQWRRSGVFIVNIVQISQIFLE